MDEKVLATARVTRKYHPMVVPQDRNHPGRHRPEEAEEVIVFFVGAHKWKEGHGGETVVSPMSSLNAACSPVDPG